MDTCYVWGILAKSDKLTGYLFYDTILWWCYCSEILLWLDFIQKEDISWNPFLLLSELKSFLFLFSEHYAYDDRRRVSSSSWKSITQYLIFMCYMNCYNIIDSLFKFLQWTHYFVCNYDPPKLMWLLLRTCVL